MPQTTHTSGIDAKLLYAVLAVQGIGLMAVFSASHVPLGASNVVRQLLWVLLGCCGMAVMVRVDYRLWSRYWRLLLFSVIGGLALTILLASPVNGARSWIHLGAFSLQPSEFSKLALILALAGLLSRFGAKIQTLSFFLRSILFVAVPILLVLAQPDFGTGMILCAIWLGMVFVAGARWWMLLAVCLGTALLLLAAWSLPLPGGRTLIKDYQKQRLNFLHADPAHNGYNQRQARIAIGAGQFWGRGYLHGAQTQRGFIPEQNTDFIFAVWGEEFGLLGCLLVLGLYQFILLRLLKITEEAESSFGRLVVAGVTAMLAVHVIINIGMCLSLLPVAGVPLPFVSYGGSHALMLLLAMGIVLNISRHRRQRRSWVVAEELVRM